MTSIRLPISVALSVCTTILLFWFLGMLIAGDPGGGGEFFPVIRGIDFTTHIPETEPVKIVRVKPVFEKPKQTHETPIVTVDRQEMIRGIDPSEIGPPGGGFDPRGELLPRRGDSNIARVGGTDRGPVPEVRLEPEYPASARDRGLEGWITFRFTVATDGSVKDIAILDSQPPRVWDSATLRAVSRWKYQPAIKDGRPVEQVGVKVTYRYELER